MIFSRETISTGHSALLSGTAPNLFFHRPNVLITAFCSGEKLMRIQTKSFNWPGRGTHVIMIAQGIMNTSALIKMISEVAALAIANPNCKVLIDCIDSECTADLKRIETLLTQLQSGIWPVQNKVALISSLKYEEYARLSDVSALLAANGFPVAVFQDAQAAASWLGG